MPRGTEHEWVAVAGPARTAMTWLPIHRREAPDERGEALNCGHVGWGIAAMQLLNRLKVALAAPATSHPVRRCVSEPPCIGNRFDPH